MSADLVNLLCIAVQCGGCSLQLAFKDRCLHCIQTNCYSPTTNNLQHNQQPPRLTILLTKIDIEMDLLEYLNL